MNVGNARRAVVGALAGLLALSAQGQALPPPCPTADQVAPVHLFGLWRAEFDGLAQGATLLIEKHPEFAERVSGGINRDGERAQLAGDIDEGELTLEESVNGVNISATWLGDVVEGSCGREIRGQWRAEGGAGRAYPFVLRKR